MAKKKDNEAQGVKDSSDAVAAEIVVEADPIIARPDGEEKKAKTTAQAGPEPEAKGSSGLFVAAQPDTEAKGVKPENQYVAKKIAAGGKDFTIMGRALRGDNGVYVGEMYSCAEIGAEGGSLDEIIALVNAKAWAED